MQILTRSSVRAAGALGIAAAALLLTPVASSSSKAAETCFGVNATIVGTPGNDTLNGTIGDDVIVAGAGDDVVYGLGGNDLICGGTGNDILYGGPGNDRIDAGPDSNTLFGGLGDDQLIGPGYDDLVKYIDAPGPVTVDLAAGTATGEGNDTLSGIEGVKGSGYDDHIYGDDGDNYFDGYYGNDYIDGRGGSDSLFFTASGAVTVDMARGTAKGQGNDRLANIETVVGSRDKDRIYGTSGPDFLIGTDGSDLINGRGGNDALIGDFFGDPHPGNDTLIGGPGNDILAGVAGDDRLFGGPGEQDIASYWYAKGIKANLARGRVTGEGIDTLRGVEGVFGSASADTMTGNGGSNLFFGDTGRDKLSGAGGDDFLDGGAGLDLLNGGKGQDYCLEGERRASCEIGGLALASAGATVSHLRALARGPAARLDDADEIDYGENPTCKTRLVNAGFTPQGGVRKRPRHVAGSTPPSRVVPAVHRRANPRTGILSLLGPVAEFAGADTAIGATWQPILYRYQHGSWKEFHVFPELHTVIRATASDGAVWSDASGKIVQKVSFQVGSGRYAWEAKTVVGDGTPSSQSLEPHLNYGNKGGRFQQWCRF